MALTRTAAEVLLSEREYSHFVLSLDDGGKKSRDELLFMVYATVYIPIQSVHGPCDIVT